jgi:DASH complex subunit DAD2
MASGMLCSSPATLLSHVDSDTAHIAKPQQDTESESDAHLPLPQTLVRIPMQHVDQSELPQSDNAEDSAVK